MTNNNSHTNYSAADINRYLSGQMTANEMHELERAALQDPFLWDAIEGYRDSDKQTTGKHLNEITAAITGERKDKVIAMPAKKNDTWQIAASIIVLLGIGILLFYKSGQNETFLADTKQKSIGNENIQKNEPPLQPIIKPDSLLAAAKPMDINLSNKTGKSSVRKKALQPEAAKPSSQQNNQLDIASASPKKDNTLNELTLKARRPSEDSGDNYTAMANRSGFQSKTVVTGYKKTDSATKDKPFVLSEVEEISVGKQHTKRIDTSLLKPEGGWPSFQNYLSGKMTKKDSASLGDVTFLNGSLELEFSVSENGYPYNIKATKVQDSATANEAIRAIKDGPRWINKNKEKKRIKIAY